MLGAVAIAGGDHTTSPLFPDSVLFFWNRVRQPQHRKHCVTRVAPVSRGTGMPRNGDTFSKACAELRVFRVMVRVHSLFPKPNPEGPSAWGRLEA